MQNTKQMIKAYYGNGERPDILGKGLRIIDIGGANSFAHGHLDAVVDIREPQASATHKFVGDINEPGIWMQLIQHIDQYGEFDYAICTHTLEDIANPIYVCKMMEKIAKAGVIVTPSKYRELARFSNPAWRGYMHHRWVFDFRQGQFTGYPKSGYLELAVFDDVHLKLPNREELIVEWEGEINLREVNNGMPFNGEKDMMQQYIQLVVDEIQ